MRGLSASLLENPASGAAQIINHVSGAKLIPELKLSPEKSYEFGSLAWHANTIGQAVGTATTVFMIAKGSRALLSSAAFGRTLAKSSTALGAMAGSIYDGLAPVKEGDAFWREKAANTAAGALQFGALYGIGKFLGAPAMASRGAYEPFKKLVKGFGTGALASVPATELRSIGGGQGFSSGRELAEHAYAAGISGGALSLGHHFDHGTGKAAIKDASSPSPGKTPFSPASPGYQQPRQWRILTSDPAAKRLTGVASDGAVVAIVDGHRVVKFAPNGDGLAGAIVDKEGRVAAVKFENGKETIFDPAAAEHVAQAVRADSGERAISFLKAKLALSEAEALRQETEAAQQRRIDDHRDATEQMQTELLFSREAKSMGGRNVPRYSPERQTERFYERLARGLDLQPRAIEIGPFNTADLSRSTNPDVRSIVSGLDRLQQRAALRSPGGNYAPSERL